VKIIPEEVMMSIKVRIPTPLQNMTQNKAEVESSGTNISEVIDDLERNFPGIKERICDEKGNIRRFINIYVNEEDVRFLKQSQTSLKNGDEVSIIPAIAGG
jgi:MoaD family protein